MSAVRDDGRLLPPRIATGLVAAEISPSKHRPARSSGLTDSERDLYFWILRNFATSGRPSSAEIRGEAGRLGLDIESALESLDEVYVRLAPNGAGEWRPDSAVVVAGAIGSGDASFCCCCPVLNFFAAATHAEEWLEQHGDVRGEVIAIRDAVDAGRVVFGDVLVGV
jgi:hypothetical protein